MGDLSKCTGPCEALTLSVSMAEHEISRLRFAVLFPSFQLPRNADPDVQRGWWKGKILEVDAGRMDQLVYAVWSGFFCQLLRQLGVCYCCMTTILFIYLGKSGILILGFLWFQRV